MAKKKTSRKKPAKKTGTRKKKPAKKTAARAGKSFASEGPLPPKQRAKALRKLRKIAIRPMHPSEATGPSMALDSDAPMPKQGKPKKRAAKRAKKKR
jgi:hypothetical protein